MKPEVGALVRVTGGYGFHYHPFGTIGVVVERPADDAKEADFGLLSELPGWAGRAPLIPENVPAVWVSVDYSEGNEHPLFGVGGSLIQAVETKDLEELVPAFH